MCFVIGFVLLNAPNDKQNGGCNAADQGSNTVGGNHPGQQGANTADDQQWDSPTQEKAVFFCRRLRESPRIPTVRSMISMITAIAPITKTNPEKTAIISVAADQAVAPVARAI